MQNQNNLKKSIKIEKDDDQKSQTTKDRASRSYEERQNVLCFKCQMSTLRE